MPAVLAMVVAVPTGAAATAGAAAPHPQWLDLADCAPVWWTHRLTGLPLCGVS